ncbi:hypothetical protein CsatB_013121 [Cannabis sativa]
MSAVIPPPLPDVIIPSLPNDLALNILARVPRQYHLVLSAVSKSIRLALSSPQLYTTRSILNLTENLLYLKVSSMSLGTENWFAIYRKPIVSADPICNGLLRFARLPPNPHKLEGSVEAVVGHNIYVIGGNNSNDYNVVIPSSDVWILDCRSHTWEQGPSIGIPRMHASVAVVDEKIYVIGGWTEESWVEVFDPVIGHWEHIPSPLDGIRAISATVEVVNGIILVKFGEAEFRLNPKTKMWEVSKHNQPYYVNGGTDCKVDGIAYRSRGNRGRIEWYDDRERRWKEVRGVMEAMPQYVCSTELVNLKERLFFMWGDVSYESSSTDGVVKLCGGEIEVSRRNEGDGVDLWGEVHKVTLLPESTFGISEESFELMLFVFFSDSFSVCL